MTEGIKVIQQKLAGLIHELTEGEGGDNYDGPRSPEYGGGGDGFGYSTSYGGNGGNQGAWGGAGGTTPFGQTPFGGGGNTWS